MISFICQRKASFWNVTHDNQHRFNSWFAKQKSVYILITFHIGWWKWNVQCIPPHWCFVKSSIRHVPNYSLISRTKSATTCTVNNFQLNPTISNDTSKKEGIERRYLSNQMSMLFLLSLFLAANDIRLRHTRWTPRLLGRRNSCQKFHVTAWRVVIDGSFKYH